MVVVEEKSVTIENHFIQSYHCSYNRLEVAEKHRVNCYSFVILASHVVLRSRGSSGHFTSIHRTPLISGAWCRYVLCACMKRHLNGIIKVSINLLTV